MQDLSGSWAMQRYWLASGMARALGVNLPAAIRAGALSHERLDAMVAACGGCGREGQCLAWLATTPSATAAPAYCAIGADLAALGRRMGRRAG